MKQVFTFFRKAAAGIRSVILPLAVLCASATGAQAQHLKLKVFFVGNSFTGNHDMPNILRDIAKSMGDTLEYDANVPGPYTLEDHKSDATTLDKIRSQNWNYLVLQEQGQRPSLDYTEVLDKVYPAARFLDSFAHDTASCVRTVFFRTWGYPDGDAVNCPSNPIVCNYRGMDSLLNERYAEMAINNQALLSPVGNVFREILQLSPSAALFETDRLHPTEMGSYAIALTFYALLYRQDPGLVPFEYTLTPPDALLVKNVVRSVVFAELPKWHVYEFDPKVGFNETISGADVSFSSDVSLNVTNYRWDFGDGHGSEEVNPVHTYTASGTYEVKLYGDNCIITDSARKTISVVVTSIGEELAGDATLRLYPNPATDVLQISAGSPSLLDQASVRVLNLLGAEVLAPVVYKGQALDLRHLPAGMYLLQLRSASGAQFTCKFLHR